MIGCDIDSPSAFNALKFVMKLRENRSLKALYKEYPTWYSEEAKRADEYAFLIDHTF
jgi:hypothetical protein